MNETNRNFDILLVVFTLLLTVTLIILTLTINPKLDKVTDLNARVDKYIDKLTN